MATTRNNQNTNIPYNNRIIFIGECIDSNDPMRLGRIRAILKTENTTDREKSVNQSLGVTDKWSDSDPFVINPLLPIFINVSPKESEYVHLVYSNPDDKSNKDKYYISGVFSSLTNLEQEPLSSAINNKNLGSRNKKAKELVNKETGEVFEKRTEGVYSHPNDISIDGRGSADIVVKDNSVILRAGKYNGKPSPNIYPTANNNRAFLQLSRYDTKTQYGTPETLYKYKFEHKEIKFLIEYNITNPDNLSNSYSGNIFLYNLKKTEKTGTQNFNIDSIILNDEKSLFKNFSFVGLSKQKVIELINTIILGVAKSDIPYLGDLHDSITPKGPLKIDGGLTIPFYFRPQPELYEKLNSDNSTTAEKLFVGNLMSGIYAVQTDLTRGYGLVYANDQKKGIVTTVPFKPEKNVIIPEKQILLNNTASLMGGDYVYLLSHKSVKKNQGKINMDNTIYGIGEKVVSDEIEPKTSSMVRGEELVELLNLIVQFLITHVHPYHGMPPNSKSLNGVAADNILQELLNANEKVLNKYIRIN